MRPWIPVLLLLMLGLAGCGGNDDDGGAPQPAEEPVGQTISGVVVTPTIQPIPGAKVVLTPGGLEDTTDLFGRFRFTGLDAGAYIVSAQAPDHEATKLSLQVREDEISRPRVILSPILPPSPGHQTISFDGFITSSFGQADETVEPYKETLGLDGCTCTFFFSVPRDTVAMTLEIIWEDNVRPPEPAPAPAFRWTIAPLSLSHQASGSGPSEILAVLTAQDFEGSGPIDFAQTKSMNLQVQADENFPAHEQSFQVFLTIWEVDMPPDGWSFALGDR